MRFLSSAVLLPLLCTLPSAFALKPQATVAPDTATLPSALLQPSLETLTQAIGTIKLEKWKNGSIRAEAAPNLDSIQKDLQTALPSLLKNADEAPNSMSALLPVLRNVDALYDVVLRVMDGARVVAPAEQGNALQEALTSLDKGRRALQDRLMALANGQEKQLSDLQSAIKNLPPPPVCPVVAPAESPKPAKKKVVKKKPAAPAAAQPNGASKPNP